MHGGTVEVLGSDALQQGEAGLAQAGKLVSQLHWRWCGIFCALRIGIESGDSLSRQEGLHASRKDIADEPKFGSPSHLVNLVLQSYKRASRNRYWSGRMYPACSPDEFESPKLRKSLSFAGFSRKFCRFLRSCSNRNTRKLRESSAVLPKTNGKFYLSFCVLLTLA